MHQPDPGQKPLVLCWFEELYQPTPKSPSSTLTLDSFIPAILTSIRKDPWSMQIHSLSPGDLFLCSQERCRSGTFATVHFHANLLNLMLQLLLLRCLILDTIVYRLTWTSLGKNVNYFMRFFLPWSTTSGISNVVLVALTHVVVHEVALNRY